MYGNRVTVSQGSELERRVGRNFRALREARQWPLREVAERMKAFGYSWHQTVVAKIETGQRPLRLSEAADLAALYEVSLDRLLVDPAVTAGHAEEIEKQIQQTEEQLAAAAAQRQEVWGKLGEIEAEEAALQVDLDTKAAQVAFLQATLNALRQALKEAER